MGINPVLQYPAYNAEYSGEEKYNTNTAKRIGFRWKTVVRCENLETGEWISYCRLQIKVKDGKPVDSISLSFDPGHPQDKYYMSATRARTQQGTAASQSGFPANDTWTDVYLNPGWSGHTSYGYSHGSFFGDQGLLCISNFQARTDKSVKTDDQISTQIEASPAVVSSVYCHIHSRNYGGIDYTSPVLNTFDIPQQSIAQTSFNVRYELTAPYDMTVRISVKENYRTQVVSTEVTQDNNMSLATYSVSNLSPNTHYSINIEAECGNGETVSNVIYCKTLPIYITDISCSDSYVNETESISLVPSVTPNDASIKTLKYENLQDGGGFTVGRYNGTSVSAEGGTTITGKTNAASRQPYALKISATDGSGKAKQVNVYVCRPAESIVLTRSLRRIATNQTYSIDYRIFPEGSTDTAVTFESDDTSIATVTSDGVVTGVSEGEAIITLTLARRGIDEYGHEISVEPATAELHIKVSDASEWIDLTEQSFLTTDFIDDVYNNLAFLREKFNTYEYNGQLISIPALDAPQTQGRLTPLYDVAEILNTIESDVDTIYNATKNINHDFINGFGSSANTVYDSPQTWEGVVSGSIYFIQRWVGYLYYLHDFLSLEGIIE